MISYNILRGYMARDRFRIKLANYREQASQQELMEKQYQKILQDCADSILKTFHVSELSEEEQKQEGKTKKKIDEYSSN